jgi:sigma-E factor negative regulatory protein RseC
MHSEAPLDQARSDLHHAGMPEYGSSPASGRDDTLEHTGIVQAVDGGRAWIAIAVAGCSSCGRKSGCGVGKLAGGGRTTIVELPAPDGLQPGDRVTVGIAQSAVNRAALLGYLVPAMLIVLGAVAGDLLRPGDTGAVLGALAGLVIGLAASRIISRHSRRPSDQLSILAA